LLAFIEKVARALHAAHEAGVVHRDIKPGNVMVTRAGEPIVLDFGLALVQQDGVTPIDEVGSIHGSPYYMSPEQILGESDKLDRRTDIYSLGATLFECLTLCLPFEGTSQEELFREILGSPHGSPRILNTAVTRELEAVVDMTLSKNPANRYPTAEAFADDLRAIIEGRPVRARRSRFAIGRTRSLQAAVALTALLLIGICGFVAGSNTLREPGLSTSHSLDPAVESALEDGFRDLDKGLLPRARASFELALLRKPDCIEAIAGLALVSIHADSPQQALQTLDRHAALEILHPALRQLRAEALLISGRPLEALFLDEPGGAAHSELDLFIAAQRMLFQAARDNDASAYSSAATLLTRAALLAPGPRALYHQQCVRAAEAANDESTARQSRNVLDTHWPAASRRR